MKITLMCALALATATPAFAHAGVGDERGPSITVRYGDLDLSRQQDARTLLARIDDAAMQSCGARPFSDPLQYSIVLRSTCHAETVAHAVSQLNIPAVSALYQANRTLASAD